jgi:predicted RNA-binding Zn-ribbon protein involved in translation (DUF1610 family)
MKSGLNNRVHPPIHIHEKCYNKFHQKERQFDMKSCSHNNLLLLPVAKKKMRCKYCHLTIKADELGKSFCPECFETGSDKRYDFEEVVEAETGVQRYRCEDCGVIIESGLSI